MEAAHESDTGVVAKSANSQGGNRPHAMAGGDGQWSYDKNSDFQRHLFDIASPALTKALERFRLPLQSSTLYIADLGCSTGKNSITQTNILLDSLKSKFPSDLQIMVSFSDLPDNDFNLLLKNASEAQRNRDQFKYFAAAVPGSFYTQLFPRSSLHIITCNTALHWMARVPQESETPGWNPGTVWYSRAAKQQVKDAYQAQGLKGISDFLHCRAQELVPGGLLWIYVPGPGRREPLPQAGYEGDAWIDIIDDAWRDLVEEGLLDRKTLDEFNMPVYYPSLEEIKRVVDASGCYALDTLEYVESFPPAEWKASGGQDRERAGVKQAGLVWAVVNSLITGVLGSAKAELLFERMKRNVTLRLEGYFTAKMYTCVALIRK